MPAREAPECGSTTDEQHPATVVNLEGAVQQNGLGWKAEKPSAVLMQHAHGAEGNALVALHPGDLWKTAKYHGFVLIAENSSGFDVCFWPRMFSGPLLHMSHLVASRQIERWYLVGTHKDIAALLITNRANTTHNERTELNVVPPLLPAASLVTAFLADCSWVILGMAAPLPPALKSSWASMA